MALFGKKGVVGLEVDSREIRAVELGGEADDARILAWGRAPLPEDCVSEGQINDPDQVREALSDLKKNSGMQSSEVLLGVFNPGVLVRFAHYPQVAKEKRDTMIRMQAQDFLPLPMSSVVLDYAVTGKVEDEELEVLLVAARREMINQFMAGFQNTGWRLKDIEASPLVLMRALPKDSEEETVAVVDIGQGLTGMMIMNEKTPRLVRLLPVQFQEIAKIKNTEPDQVLESTHTGDEEVLPWVEGLINEMTSSINYYQGQQGKNKVGRLFLSGSGSRLSGLPESVSTQLGIPVEVLDPLYNAGISSHQDDDIIDEAADFSVCMSLALRGLEG